jgi:hypothetical protein
MSGMEISPAQPFRQSWCGLARISSRALCRASSGVIPAAWCSAARASRRSWAPTVGQSSDPSADCMTPFEQLWSSISWQPFYCAPFWRRSCCGPLRLTFLPHFVLLNLVQMARLATQTTMSQHSTPQLSARPSELGAAHALDRAVDHAVSQLGNVLPPGK